MSDFNNALQSLEVFLEEKNIPYMVIGGLANLIWGEPRLTQDIDVTILVTQEKIENFIEQASSNFKLRINNPQNFVNLTRVLPAEIDGIKIDFIFAGLEYERQAIKRAKKVKLDNISVKVCSAEDLIIHKAISDRARDFDDVSGILLKQGKNLKKDYILKWLREFSKALEKPIDEKFKKLWNELVNS